MMLQFERPNAQGWGDQVLQYLTFLGKTDFARCFSIPAAQESSTNITHHKKLTTFKTDFVLTAVIANLNSLSVRNLNRIISEPYGGVLCYYVVL